MPLTIYWTLLDGSQVPAEAGEDFLSPAEQRKLSGFRFPKRREDWLLGRRAAKALLLGLPEYGRYSPEEIEVLNTPAGVPYIRLPGVVASPDRISISHSNHFAFCLLASGAQVNMGADLEKIEPRAQALVEDFFTPAEREWVGFYRAGDRDLAVTLVWSAKEAMLKALGIGLGLDTRRVEVCRVDGLPSGGGDPDGWLELPVREVDRQPRRHWAAWWRQRGGFVMTVAGFGTVADLRSAVLLER